MQEWKLARQESRRTVETEVFGWDGKNGLSDKCFFLLAWAVGRNCTQLAGLGKHLVYVCVCVFVFVHVWKKENTRIHRR